MLYTIYNRGIASLGSPDSSDLMSVVLLVALNLRSVSAAWVTFMILTQVEVVIHPISHH